MRSVYRCVFLLALMPLSALGRPGDPFDFAGAGIERLHAAIDAGEITCEELVRYYTSRIERFDKTGPRINAFITLNPAALDRARELDRRSTPGRNPPLYGIPFIAKDNYDTSDLPTSGGSAALRRSVPKSNAFIVQKLLDQGAILMGKSNMSELAASYGRLGYSSAGGLTVNPYDTSRTASGSSSGSAAGLAAGFAVFALGTDTAGSVRGPASVTGLVGLRPTLGLTSRAGVIPLSLTFDTTGVLTHTVDDLAIVLDAIGGPDPQDAATLLRPPAHVTYKVALDCDARLRLKGARLGVVANFKGANTEVDRVQQKSLKTLEALGAVLIPVTLPREFENLWNSLLAPVGQAEFKPQFERYLRTLPASQPHTLAALIAVSESVAIATSDTPVNPARLDALRVADDAQLTDSPMYIHSLTEVIPALRRQLQAILASNGLQALVFSTLSCPASPRFDRLDSSYVCADEDSYRAAYIAAAVGFPEITVPAGSIGHDLPVGLSFLADADGESRLLALASEFERHVPALPPPSFH